MTFGRLSSRMISQLGVCFVLRLVSRGLLVILSFLEFEYVYWCQLFVFVFVLAALFVFVIASGFVHAELADIGPLLVVASVEAVGIGAFVVVGGTFEVG